MRNVFFDPAAQGVIPAVIGRDKEALERVNGRYWALDMLGRTLIGPLAGSWAFTVNRVVPFLADAVSFAISALFVTRLPEISPAPGQHEPVFTAIRTGFRHLRQSHELSILVVGVAVYNFAYNTAISTFVLYTSRVLTVGPIGYGAFYAALACGAIVVGWRGTAVIRTKSAIQIYVMVAAGVGTAWILVALFANIWATGVLFVGIGAMNILNTTAITSARQRLAPEGSLGRIVTLFRISSLGAGGIGALSGGWIAEHYGLGTPMIVAGVIQLVASVVVRTLRSRMDHGSG